MSATGLAIGEEALLSQVLKLVSKNIYIRVNSTEIRRELRRSACCGSGTGEANVPVAALRSRSCWSLWADNQHQVSVSHSYGFR